MNPAATPNLGAMRVRSAQRFTIATAVRFEDLDPNCHVNHARYLAYLEEGRLAFRRYMEKEVPQGAALAWPIGEITVRYVSPLRYPQTVEVELAPLAVGQTSLTLGYGIFAGDVCAALAMTRSVCVSPSTGTPEPIPPTVADYLRRMIEPSAMP